MALGDIKKKKIFEKTDSEDKHFLSSAKQTEISASYAAAEHLDDAAILATTGPIMFQLQLIEEDIDELRRYTTASIQIEGQISGSQISSSGNISATDGVFSGNLDVAGEIECDHLNITDLDDGIHFTDTPVLIIDSNTDVNLGVDGASSVSLILLGHNQTMSAGNNIILDAVGDINFDSATGNINFKDQNTTQLSLDMDGTAGEQIIKLEVDSDDLVFQQYDGTEVLRVGDDGTAEFSKRKITLAGGTDGNHTGADVVYFGGTTSMTTGAIYHFKSDGTWELADADDNTKSDGLLGVALGAASDTNGVLLRGMVTLDHDPGAVGDPIYLTTTAGDSSATAPSGNNNIVRIIGYCLHASNGNIWFNPDSTFVEVTA